MYSVISINLLLMVLIFKRRDPDNVTQTHDKLISQPSLTIQLFMYFFKQLKSCE